MRSTTAAQDPAKKSEGGEDVHEDRKTYTKQTVNKFIFGDKHLGISGYMDTFGDYSLNNLGTNKRRPWNSNPEYMNEFGLAYGFISFEYETEDIRARVAIHGGEIVERMYINERPLFQLFREANAGYLVNKKFNVEMGIFPSFYGSESFINKDNQHATRAIMTDFAPDYVAGMRFNYEPTDRWEFKLEITNGWQNISNDHQKALGTLVVYKLADKLVLNWGSYLGNEAASGQSMILRNYHNFFTKIFWGDFIFIPMFDVFYERRDAEDRTVYGINSGLSVRYAITKHFGVAARWEHLYDPNEIIPDLVGNAPYGTPNAALPPHAPGGFQADGYTLTFEYLPSKQMTIRIEGRYTMAANAIYIKGDNEPTNRDAFLYTSFAIGF